MHNEEAQKVRKGEELPTEALKLFLQKQGLVHHKDSPLEVVQFTHSYSNLTYAPKGAIKRGHDMGREYKVQHAIKTAFSKVPKMLAYTEDLDILGTPFYIMEKMEGIILNYQAAKQRNIPTKDYKKIANSWMETFVQLHQLDYKEVGLETLGRPDGYVERQVFNWGKQYKKAATDDVPTVEKVIRWMEEHQPNDYDQSLIHNDYKFDNVVFENEEWKTIHAVLDWEMATLGDPLMDLGTSLGYWTMAKDSDFVKQGIPSPTVFKGNLSRSEIVELYAQKSGKEINHLIFYYVYGLFKIAVIAQQIYFRYKHGYTSDPRFENLNKATALCCNLAWKSIQTKKID